MGLGHNGIGTQWDLGTMGLGHIGTGAQRDWGIMGLGHVCRVHTLRQQSTASSPFREEKYATHLHYFNGTLRHCSFALFLFKRDS